MERADLLQRPRDKKFPRAHILPILTKDFYGTFPMYGLPKLTIGRKNKVQTTK